jgi:glycosyltransferase involved in cell wall biosynthesis
MIKILHIAKPVSGVGVYIQLLSKYLNSNKFQNEIILNNSDNNIEILDTHGHKIKSYHLKLEREVSFFKDVFVLFQMVRIMKKNRPDVIHCHSAKAGILGRIAGSILKIKTIYTPHAYSYLSTASKEKKMVLRSIEKFFGYFSCYTLTCSYSEYIRATEDLKIDKKKVFIWNNSIENELTLKSSRYSKNLAEEYICSIGRPCYQKNTELMIKAILIAKESIGNVHLVILGVGFYSPSLEKIKKFIEENNLSQNITLIPWLEREESLDILNNSLFYISSSRYEGLPYAVIEALALKKPCILTNVDGNKDLVTNDYNGFLVAQEPRVLAARILEMYSNRKRLAMMSRNSRSKFEKFYQINKNIKSLENLYLRPQ